MITFNKISGTGLFVLVGEKQSATNRIDRDKFFYYTNIEGINDPFVFNRMPTANDVYVVNRNADSCEGRGPMVLDKIFANLTDAVRYIFTKTEFSPYYSISVGVNIHKEPYCISSFGGFFTIDLITVE